MSDGDLERLAAWAARRSPEKSHTIASILTSVLEQINCRFGVSDEAADREGDRFWLTCSMNFDALRGCCEKSSSTRCPFPRIVPDAVSRSIGGFASSLLA